MTSRSGGHVGGLVGDFTRMRLGVVASAKDVKSRYSQTEHVGVHAVGLIVTGALGWIFREQPVADVGVDAHIELVEGEPTGKHIAVQIKTGKSHFVEQENCYVYYGDLVHLDYWLGHSLPVILIAHLPKSNETLWVHITERAITRTAKRWKIEIPKQSWFGIEARRDLIRISNGWPTTGNSYIDSLTKLCNRRYLSDNLPAEIARARLDQRVLSVVMADVDCMKEINQRYGHLVGDEVLRQVAALLRAGVGSHGWVARLGGDKFALVLPSSGSEGAREVAEAIRGKFSAASVQISAGPINLTLSFGVAQCSPGTEDADRAAASLLQSADPALYQAKVAGRNCVHVGPS